MYVFTYFVFSMEKKIELFICLSIAQSAGAVEYTDCTSAEG